MGASYYERLQRSRYRLSFENTQIEGILDGGHNTLAIGTHILTCALRTNTITRKIRTWPDFKELWNEYREDVESLRKLSKDQDEYSENALDFLVPLEILVPSDLESEESTEAFNNSLLSICSARNNNVQLTSETKANKKGFYEDLRKALPANISNRVEWKTNDGGEIKVRDLIALAWIPLSVLDASFVPRIVPQNIYRNKGECVRQFDTLMSRDDVSEATVGEYTRKVHNEAIRSALKLAGELPELYDKIYREFPFCYNENDGKFGKRNFVKMANNMRIKPTSYFTTTPVEYRYPDGLIMPLVYGLKALMEVNDDGLVSWSQEPHVFLDQHLANIVRKYRVILDAFSCDPQKVGKNEGSYELVQDAFKTELMLQEISES